MILSSNSIVASYFDNTILKLLIVKKKKKKKSKFRQVYARIGICCVLNNCYTVLLDSHQAHAQLILFLFFITIFLCNKLYSNKTETTAFTGLSNIYIHLEHVGYSLILNFDYFFTQFRLRLVAAKNNK